MDITNDREYQFKVLYMEEFVLLSTKPISKINVLLLVCFKELEKYYYFLEKYN